MNTKRIVLVLLVAQLLTNHVQATCQQQSWWEMIIAWLLSFLFGISPTNCDELPAPSPPVGPPVTAPTTAPSPSKCHSKPVTAVPANSPIQYYDAFANMRDLFVWPTPDIDPDQISSTFGPRLKFSDGLRYDWHRGVDINGKLGNDVLASYDGTVLKAEEIGDGGLKIVLQHKFKDSNVQFHGRTVDKWFTYYAHLSATSVAVGTVVQAGQKIGEVGKSGSAAFLHLHHEVRVGTYCSLEWALTNPNSTCNTFNFDPHVHPLLVYPESTIPCSSFDVTVSQEPSASQDARVTVSTEDRVPDTNQYTVQLVAPGTFSDTVLKKFTLNLNLRTGFDAASDETLDVQDKSKPYLDPEQFITLDTQWNTDIVIPKSWVGPKTATQVFVVTVTNIWHDTSKTVRFGEGSVWT